MGGTCIPTDSSSTCFSLKTFCPDTWCPNRSPKSSPFNFQHHSQREYLFFTTFESSTSFFFSHRCTPGKPLILKTSTIVILALASLTKSSPFPCSNSTCGFGLAASGGQSGTVGQLDDGQTRIGGGLPPAKFCMTGTSIKDSTGRGCIITGKLSSGLEIPKTSTNGDL